MDLFSHFIGNNEFAKKRMSSDNTEKEKIRIKFKKHSQSTMRMIPPRPEKSEPRLTNRNKHKLRENQIKKDCEKEELKGVIF